VDITEIGGKRCHINVTSIFFIPQTQTNSLWVQNFAIDLEIRSLGLEGFFGLGP
jgi:hypothetical protein